MSSENSEYVDAEKRIDHGWCRFHWITSDDLLLSTGWSVRILDCLSAQVHPGRSRPDHLSRDAELVVGDLSDPRALQRAHAGIDVVVHPAAEVGVGQSMYEIVRYAEANKPGTAVLLEALARQPVERLVCASMSIYGEGDWHADLRVAPAQS